MQGDYDFRIYLLGEFRLYRSGTLIQGKEWHTRQARQLFKLLLTEYTRPISSQRLMQLLWSDQIDHPDKTLRSAASALRNVLEPGRTAHTPSHILPRGRAGYMLQFPDDCTVWIDTHEFKRLLQAAARETDASLRRPQLEAALTLYTGDYLQEDEAAVWTQHTRAQLRTRYFQGVLTLMNIYNQEGLFHEALNRGYKALAFDTYCEPLYRALMQSQVMAGNCAGALEIFAQCRQNLVRGLGVDPSPQTLQLHRAILMHCSGVAR